MLVFSRFPHNGVVRVRPAQFGRFGYFGLLVDRLWSLLVWENAVRIRYSRYIKVQVRVIMTGWSRSSRMIFWFAPLSTE